jgi:hypothetical protein
LKKFSSHSMSKNLPDTVTTVKRIPLTPPTHLSHHAPRSLETSTNTTGGQPPPPSGGFFVPVYYIANFGDTIQNSWQFSVVSPEFTRNSRNSRFQRRGGVNNLVLCPRNSRPLIRVDLR